LAPLLSKYLADARLSRISRFVGAEILDAGCGHGELLDYLSSNTRRVVLLDRSSERQREVERRIVRAEVSAKFVIADIDHGEIRLDEAPFDTVVMAALLEHLNFPQTALQNIRKMMKKDARLLLTTPSPLGGRLHGAASRISLVYAEAAAEHVSFYSHDTLRVLLESNGFCIERYERFLLGLNQLVVAHLNET